VSATTAGLVGREVVEKLRRITTAEPREWTEHNDNDPGVNLLELCAWLTEELLKRANRMPEAGAVHASRLAAAALALLKDVPPSERRAIAKIKFLEGAEFDDEPPDGREDGECIWMRRRPDAGSAL
jgi:hypothetical protein